MIKEAIAKVVEKHDLTEGEMIDVMDQVMGGEATPAQIAAFIFFRRSPRDDARHRRTSHHATKPDPRRRSRD